MRTKYAVIDGTYYRWCGVVLALPWQRQRRPTHSGLFNLITDLHSRSQHSLIITWKVRHDRVVVLLQFMKPKWKTEAFLIKNDRLLSLLSFFLIQKLTLKVSFANVIRRKRRETWVILSTVCHCSQGDQGKKL